MVGTGFNSSEADGMAGMGAQFKTPEKKHEEELKRTMDQAVSQMKVVPVKEGGAPKAKTVETTTVRFLARYQDPSGESKIALFEIPNVPKAKARDPADMQRQTEGYLNNPKKLADAVRQKTVQFVSLSEEKSKLVPYEEVKGKRKMNVVFGSSEHNYYYAGSPKPADQDALLAYLNKGNPVKFTGVVTQ